jgi:hypothetical protein
LPLNFSFIVHASWFQNLRTSDEEINHREHRDTEK